MNLHSSLNSINVDPPSPYYHNHDMDIAIGDSALQSLAFNAVTHAGMDLFAATTDPLPLEQLEAQLFSMDESMDMDMSLGFDTINSAVPSFFDEQYA